MPPGLMKYSCPSNAHTLLTIANVRCTHLTQLKADYQIKQSKVPDLYFVWCTLHTEFTKTELYIMKAAEVKVLMFLQLNQCWDLFSQVLLCTYSAWVAETINILLFFFLCHLSSTRLFLFLFTIYPLLYLLLILAIISQRLQLFLHFIYFLLSLIISINKYFNYLSITPVLTIVIHIF